MVGIDYHDGSVIVGIDYRDILVMIRIDYLAELLS